MRHKRPAPWPWPLVRACLDIHTGRVYHFPAGSYYDQHTTQWRRAEWQAMDITRRVWQAAAKQPGDWSAADRRIMGWISRDK